MATPPGISFSTLSSPPPGPAGPRTAVAFVTGETGKGPVGQPISIQSLSEFNVKCGGREAYSPLYDWFDLFFHDGGVQAYVSRVVGPAAAVATLILKDTTPTTPLNTLTVNANSPGVWGNALSVAVVAGTVANTFQIQVSLAGALVETSPVLTSPADAVGYATTSAYITIVNDNDTAAAPTNNPAVIAATALAGGSDDLVDITETQWTNALATFTADLGPGQVAAAGRTTSAAYAALIAHATANNRTYLLDVADSPTATAVIAQAQGQQVSGVIAPGQPDPGRGGFFAPYLLIPGLPTGTAIPAPARVVPPSAAAAALIARQDAVTGNPNLPAAGDNGGGTGSGVSTYAIGLSQPGWSDADRASLDAAGVSVFRQLGAPGQSQVMLYGFNTLSVDPTWSELNWQRLRMAIADGAQRIAAADAQFNQIDSQGHMFAKFNGDLSAMLTRYYNEGALFSTSVPPAAGSSFVVDTGPAVNTVASIAAQVAAAAISVHMSPYAKFTQLFLVKVPLSQPV